MSPRLTEASISLAVAATAAQAETATATSAPAAEAGGAAAAAGEEELSVVFSTDCADMMNWQSNLVYLSADIVGQKVSSQRRRPALPSMACGHLGCYMRDGSRSKCC